MPTSTLDRVTLAIEQLDAAIEMFLAERSDASALTLAGAAEEILGQAVKLAGGENAMVEAYQTIAETHRMLHRTELRWQEYAEGENYARSAVKHMRGPDEGTLTVDLRRAAQWMIVRACANYDRLDLERTDRMIKFNNWFFENEVGI